MLYVFSNDVKDEPCNYGSLLLSTFLLYIFNIYHPTQKIIHTKTKNNNDFSLNIIITYTIIHFGI